MVLAPACAGTAGGRGVGKGCTATVREAFDPRSLQHVLPGSPPPSYLTDPPTSGPHQPSPPISGALDRPIAEAQQVGLLESGDVLIQYRGLDAAGVSQVRGLAGDRVVVAPAAHLPDGQRVVATAWLVKRSCGGLDLAALRSFVADERGKGPGTS